MIWAAAIGAAAAMASAYEQANAGARAEFKRSQSKPREPLWDEKARQARIAAEQAKTKRDAMWGLLALIGFVGSLAWVIVDLVT